MKLTVKQVSAITGVSVRALHWYDEIGLLLPSKTTQAGYRQYDEKDLERLQQILFFRELGFELKEIKAILSRPDYDKADALQKHRELLKLKRDRIDRLIQLVETILKGENTMSFQEFDMTEIEKAQKEYQKEAEERWGGTEAYQESVRRAASYGKEDWAKIKAEWERIYRSFAGNMDKDPGDPAVQSLVREWQELITAYFYPCTDEILSGLGEMYVADERFTRSIDRHAAGLAEFMSRAFKIYSGK